MHGLRGSLATPDPVSAGLGIIRLPSRVLCYDIVTRLPSLHIRRPFLLRSCSLLFPFLYSPPLSTASLPPLALFPSPPPPLWTNPPSPMPPPCTTSSVAVAPWAPPSSSTTSFPPQTVRPTSSGISWGCAGSGLRPGLTRGTVDRDEVDRLRKRFMKLDKVRRDLHQYTYHILNMSPTGRFRHHRPRRVPFLAANLLQPTCHQVRLITVGGYPSQDNH